MCNGCYEMSVMKCWLYNVCYEMSAMKCLLFTLLDHKKEECSLLVLQCLILKYSYIKKIKNKNEKWLRKPMGEKVWKKWISWIQVIIKK